VSRAVIGAMCTYERADDLQNSLDVLDAQSRCIDALVIVDNGSDPALNELVRSHRLSSRIPIDLIDPGENLGPAGGYGLAFDRIDAVADDDDLVLILDDDDPPPSPTVVEELLEAAESAFAEPHVAGIGLRGGQLDLRTGIIAPRPSGPIATEEADHLHGGWLPLYRVGALRRADAFDASLFWGFDDLELGRRLARAGFAVRVAGEVFCKIAAPNTRNISRTLAPESWRHYYRHRNLLRVLRRDRAWAAMTSMIVVRLLAKPLVNLPRSPRLALWHLQTNLQALADSWTTTPRFQTRHTP
jgi:GT2 family glycosyltransferase